MKNMVDKNKGVGIKQRIEKLFSGTFFRYLICILEKNKVRGYIYGEFVRSFYTNEKVKEIKIAIFGDAIIFAKCIQKDLNLLFSQNKGTVRFTLNPLYNEGIESIILIDKLNIGGEKSHSIRNMSIETFLSYGDFNINALAISLNFEEFGKTIKTCEAKDDLRERIISTTMEPKILFEKKPLLVLKCFILSSNLNFQISYDCYLAFNSLTNIKIGKEDAKEIRSAILCLLSSSKLSDILDNMQKARILSHFLPELSDLDTNNFNNGIYCRNDFKFTLKVVDEVCKKTDDIILRLTALLMFIGKFRAQKYNSKNRLSCHGYQYESGKMLSAIFQRLHLTKEKKHITYIQNLFIMLTNLIHLDITVLSDAAVRRIITKAGNSLDNLLLLYSCYKVVEGKESDYVFIANKIKEVTDFDNNIKLIQTVCINGFMIMNMFPNCTCKQISILKEKMAQVIQDGQAENNYESLLPILLDSAKNLHLVYQSQNQATEEMAIQTNNKEPKEITNSAKESLGQKSAIKKPQSEPKDYRIMKGNTCLALFSDGAFLLKDLNGTDVIPNIIEVNDDQTVLLQCYDSGYVNKVSLDEIWKLRRNFIYKNATFAYSSMQSLLIASDQDILHIHYLNDAEEKVPISSIKEHSMMGLKGYQIVEGKDIIFWSITSKED